MRLLLSVIYHWIIKFLSIPLRVHLALFPLSVNDLLTKRNHSRIFASVYHDFLNRMVDIPMSVKVGENTVFSHNALGTVIHPTAIIGKNCKIYQNVTIGRADIYREDSNVGEIVISDGCILCAGAKILAKNNLVLGKGTIVAANAVLLNSTGENEVWGGYRLLC